MNEIAVVFADISYELMCELESKMHVWICLTKQNKRIVDLFWQNRVDGQGDDDVMGIGGTTTFEVFEIDHEDDLCDLLDEIYQHHCGYGMDPKLHAIQLVGIDATESLREILRDYDFTQFNKNKIGFRAVNV
ncbi:hypothetical protein JD969_09230 [Planctomycetota bacterium]|nr:hypothetical protein JD969_09230 [Planctomycetota bacterium]